MPRKYVPKLPPGTVRQRDEKGRLLPADAQLGKRKVKAAAKVAPQAQPVVARKKPGPKPGFKKPGPKPAVAAKGKPGRKVQAAQVQQMASQMATAVLAPPEARPQFPTPDIYEQLRTMAVDIFNSGSRPVWMHKPEVVLTVLLRSYELRIGAIQGIWNTYLGDDGRPLSTAELMRALVLRSGLGYMRALRRDNEAVTYEAVRYARRPGDPDTRIEVTWKVTDLSGGPIKGLPRQTLDARVTSEICRTLFADIAGGYCPEDFDVPSQPPTPGTPPRPLVQRPASAFEPEVPIEEPGPAPVQEPPVAASPAPAEPLPAPTPAPEPAPVAVAPQEAPAVPGANEEVMPGRVLYRLVQVTPPGAAGPTPVYTAGISADQVSRIYEIAGQQHQEAAQKWLGSTGLKKLSWCTEEEAEELIAYLQTLSNGEDHAPPARPAPPPLTHEKAYAVLAAEVEKLELPIERVAQFLVQKYNVASLNDLLPEQILNEADEFKARSAADITSFKIAFQRMMDQAEIDPFGS